jgi:hypothetical protein
MVTALSESIAALPPDLQPPALRALARNLYHVNPRSGMQSAFDSIFDAVALLAPEHRAGPLERLAVHVQDLPENERAASFERVANAINLLRLQGVVNHQDEPPFTPLCHLSVAIEHLPPVQRARAFETVLSLLPEALPAERLRVLHTVAEKIKTLPRPDESVQLQAFLAVLREARSLEPRDRDSVLNRLQNDLANHAGGWDFDVSRQARHMINELRNTPPVDQGTP